jgi:nicotinic acid mononucleotide adenylyltransferase
MCQLATERTSTWLMCDPWEAFQSYQRTAVVLDHFDREINTVLGGVRTEEGGERREVRVMLLAGSDLIATMSEPGVWSQQDVRTLTPFTHSITLIFYYYSLIIYWADTGRSSSSAQARRSIRRSTTCPGGDTTSTSSRSSSSTTSPRPRSGSSSEEASPSAISSPPPS